jgi:hypothetical protein
MMGGLGKHLDVWDMVLPAQRMTRHAHGIMAAATASVPPSHSSSTPSPPPPALVTRLRDAVFTLCQVAQLSHQRDVAAQQKRTNLTNRAAVSGPAPAAAPAPATSKPDMSVGLPACKVLLFAPTTMRELCLGSSKLSGDQLASLRAAVYAAHPTVTGSSGAEQQQGRAMLEAALLQAKAQQLAVL